MKQEFLNGIFVYEEKNGTPTGEAARLGAEIYIGARRTAAQLKEH
jgi:hypothetical protein